MQEAEPQVPLSLDGRPSMVGGQGLSPGGHERALEAVRRFDERRRACEERIVAGGQGRAVEEIFQSASLFGAALLLSAALVTVALIAKACA